jgi:hypothetical protein
MAANWRRLTDYLAGKPVEVVLSWIELDGIVGGMPRSAIDHFPHWWHGDRPNTRAWRAAGYEAVEIRPGVAVTFRRSAGVALARGTGHEPAARVSRDQLTLRELDGLDPMRSLLIVCCSKAKRCGGSTSLRPPDCREELATARNKIHAKAELDDRRLMPAWHRYKGGFYSMAGESLQTAAAGGRLVILSGGYGVLDGLEPIGWYNRVLRLSEWPRGLLEGVIADRARSTGLDVVAFAASTADYAKLLRRVEWGLPSGRHAVLVTMAGLKGSGNVSMALGESFRAFTSGNPRGFPQQTVVVRLHP